MDIFEAPRNDNYFIFDETASKIYVMKRFSAKKTFNDVSRKSFASEAQTIDFSKSSQAASIINSWVENQINNKIKLD